MPGCMRCGKPMVGAHNAYNCLECGTAVLHDPLNNFYMDTILSQAEVALSLLVDDTRATNQIRNLMAMCEEGRLDSMESVIEELVRAILWAGVRKGHS